MEYRELDTTGFETIMNAYHTGSLMARIAVSFGYSDRELDLFFHPRHYDRFAPEGFRQAAQLLQQAKANGQKVFVYGDYDCDGVTATAIMIRALRRLGIACGYYIPNRFAEGYGLKLNRLRQAREKGYDVLITVDNGVSAQPELQWAGDNGMVRIVTDHHRISGPVPCEVLLHPDQFPEDYSCLSGAGIVYLLSVYLGTAEPRDEVMAMTAAISDVMESKGYNVQLVREGLQAFQEHACPALEMLADHLNQPADEDDIAFRIVPKINAVGRLADRANPNAVARYLLSDDPAERNRLCTQINEVNAERRQLTEEQYRRVKEACRADETFAVVALPGLHQGLTGLLAGRLTGETGRPSLVFTASQGQWIGSGRSVPGLDLMALLNGFGEQCEALGGHAQACGITLKQEKLDALRAYLAGHYHPAAPPARECLSLTAADLDPQALREVFSYRPYGQGRRLPWFRVPLTGVSDYRSLKTDHQLKWTLAVPGGSFTVLSFSGNQGYDAYRDGRARWAVGTLRQETFRGQTDYSLVAEQILSDPDR